MFAGNRLDLLAGGASKENSSCKGKGVGAQEDTGNEGASDKEGKGVRAEGDAENEGTVDKEGKGLRAKGDAGRAGASDKEGKGLRATGGAGSEGTVDEEEKRDSELKSEEVLRVEGGRDLEFGEGEE